MRTLYIGATAVFWVLVVAFWVGSLWSPRAQTSAASTATPVAPSNTPAVASTGRVVSEASDRVISAAELAKHASPTTCWLAIRGSVYDLAAYLPRHPSRPHVIEPWCGKDATDAYNTKTQGRRHSTGADSLLLTYRVGRFAPNPP